MRVDAETLKRVCLVCLRDKRACGHTAAPPNPPEALYPGACLSNQYVIGPQLGRGGFGITYLARDLSTGERVAVKEYFPQELAVRKPATSQVIPRSSYSKAYTFGLNRFLNEAQTLAQFMHPNIVRVTAFFSTNGTGYIVMPYLEGCALEEFLRAHGGRVDEIVTLGLADQLLQGLQEIHRRKLIHRDIKPQNLFLVDRRPDKLVLLDFGSARQAFGRETERITVFVTHGYAPPEQYSENGLQGTWTDIYACAATLYRCLTGQVPLPVGDRWGTDEKDLLQSPAAFAPVSRQVEEAIMNGLAMHRDKRPQDIAAFRAQLGLPVGARSGGMSPVPVPTACAPVAPVAPTTNLFDWLRRAILGVDLAEVTKRHGLVVGIDGVYAGETIPLDGEIVIGRDVSCCQLVLPEDTERVSRRHASIRYDYRERAFRLRDLGSSFGTYIVQDDGLAVKITTNSEIALKTGAQFYLGNRRSAHFRVEERVRED